MFANRLASKSLIFCFEGKQKVSINGNDVKGGGGLGGKIGEWEREYSIRRTRRKIGKKTRKRGGMGRSQRGMGVEEGVGSIGGGMGNRS